MKTKILLLVCILFGSVLYAQPPHAKGGSPEAKEKREKIEAMKVEYITSQLSLTSTEAQQFWPVYNEFMDQIHKLERDRRKSMKKTEMNELSDSEINALIQREFSLEQQILDLRIAYDKRFKEVLSIQKVGMLYKAEHTFRRELLKKMKGGGALPK